MSSLVPVVQDPSSASQLLQRASCSKGSSDVGKGTSIGPHAVWPWHTGRDDGRVGLGNGVQ